jgi:drug/metabolite transporter (DMT)-like permease
VLLPSVFLALAKSLDSAGILKTEIAQRLSVVLSLAAAYFIFQEQFNQLKIVGYVLGLAAVMCILFTIAAGGGESSKTGRMVFSTGVVWLCAD